MVENLNFTLFRDRIISLLPMFQFSPFTSEVKYRLRCVKLVKNLPMPMPTIDRPMSNMVTEVASPRMQEPMENSVADTAIRVRRPRNLEQNPKVSGTTAAKPIVILITN